MKLIMDTREKSNELLDQITRDCTYDISFEALRVGDFLWCDDNGSAVMCIEHKSVNDFYTSVLSHHIDTQIADIKQYPHYCLFIDGDWRSLYGGRSHTYSPHKSFSYNNKILSIECVHGVPVHHFRRTSDMANAIINVGRYIEKYNLQGSTEDVVRNKFTRNVNSPNYQMYSAIYGMGKKRIDALMKMYPHFTDFIAAYKNGQEFPKSIVNKQTRDFLEALENEGKTGIQH